jgi:hypothetical protein
MMTSKPVLSIAPGRGRRIFRQFAPAIAGTLILPVVLAQAAAAQDTRTLTATESDQGLATVELEGRVGKMRIVPSTAGGIQVRVEIERAQGRNRGNPQNVNLVSSRRGSTLVLSLSGDHQDLEETWMLAIPSHLRVAAKLGVGDMNIEGMRGGIQANVGVGALRIAVPDGDIDAETGVGEVVVRSGTRSYGDVDLRAGMGNGTLSIDGRQVRQQDRPPGMGERISMNGGGRDKLQIRSGVGNAQLAIGQ